MQMPQTQYEVIQCGGGLDLVTPTLLLKNGVLRNSLNFECNVAGGYNKISGYFRYDGHPNPAGAQYVPLWVGALAYVPAVGDSVTNGTATATVAAVYSDYIAVTQISGTFSAADVVTDTTGGTHAIGTIILPNSTSCTSYPISTEQDATNIVAAQQVYINAISAIPGTGNTTGGFTLNGTVYALRSNGTNAIMYASSSSGWTLVPFFNEVYFTEVAGGTNFPVDGATLTQGGVTATVKRVCLQAGAWLGATAKGKFVITNPVGGNFAAGAATITGLTGTVTLAGVQTAITLLPNGTLEYVNANFTGSASTARIYACDGVNREFEFDGTTLVPIENGTSLPAKHIIAYRNYLLVMVQSSIIWSAIGTPYDFTAIHGAGEIALGDIGTDMSIMPGNATTSALNVMTKNNTSILYGTDATTWQLMSYNTGVGCLDYGLQNMAQTYGFDPRGAFGLQTTLSYGNFNQTMLTHNIQPFIDANYGSFTYSCLNRRKSQYRLFFSNGSGLYITAPNGQFLGSMPVLFPSAVVMCFDDKFPDGSDANFMFCQNGFCYQMDQGDTFDGAAISHYMTLIYDSIQSPRMLKHYLKSSMEIYGAGYVNIGFNYSLGYGNTNYSQPANQNYADSFSNYYFDSGLTFDSNITFDSTTISPLDCAMSGTAENVAITIGGNAAAIAQYTVNSITMHYQTRRGKR